MLFTKMHGLGNDFVVAEAFAGLPAEDMGYLARRVCDRHLGVGADGLILLCRSEVADLQMRIWNADGSEAEMCGNGIRCVGKYVYEQNICRQVAFTVETRAGIRSIRLQLQGELVALVTVGMGSPILQAERIPVVSELQPVVGLPVAALGQEFLVTAVSMGNPHAVIFVPDLAKLAFSELGPVLERHPVFPQGTNVEFVQVLNRQLVRVLVWERGAGPTLACGTGACAVGVASVLNGLTDESLVVELPGGGLQIDWRGRGEVLMTGPAEQVYRGEWLL